MKTLWVPLHLPAAKLEGFIAWMLAGRDVQSVKVGQRFMTIRHTQAPANDRLEL